MYDLGTLEACSTHSSEIRQLSGTNDIGVYNYCGVEDGLDNCFSILLGSVFCNFFFFFLSYHFALSHHY